ncbi:MAG: helix-turn-helix domain-containing protein [Actinobacteria bacterium]|nr:helix-turn-helix domain-containing protein [Actinomycetota bacterium]MBW3650388.1 helix-turn-helix domain-containing protein [Actinomycetota bacterium]
MATEEPEEEARALGKAITIRRVELGLSRNDLRDRSGLSYPYVAELEKGLKSPSSKALDAISRALEMRPHELLARAEELVAGPGTLPMTDSPTPAAAPAGSGRWFGPASTAARPAPARGRRARAAPAPELTEDRVREIVREELRRLVAEAPE